MAITIRASFQRMHDVSLVRAYDETGVYVLWSSQANARPSYIGEGEILKRFVEHLSKPWATRPLDGLIAIIDEGTARERKWKAEAIELLLLKVSEDVGRSPTHNVHPGKASGFDKLLQRANHNVRTVRFVFGGCDPLLRPDARPMSALKSATVRAMGDRWVIEAHDWRRRAA